MALANLFGKAFHRTNRGNSRSPRGTTTLPSSSVFVTCNFTSIVHVAMLQHLNMFVPCYTLFSLPQVVVHPITD